MVGKRPTRRMVTLNTDLSLLELLVPDALKIFRQRYLILEQISLHAPIGRRTVARQLGPVSYTHLTLPTKALV